MVGKAQFGDLLAGEELLQTLGERGFLVDDQLREGLLDLWSGYVDGMALERTELLIQYLQKFGLIALQDFPEVFDIDGYEPGGHLIDPVDDRRHKLSGLDAQIGRELGQIMVKKAGELGPDQENKDKDCEEDTNRQNMIGDALFVRGFVIGPDEGWGRPVIYGCGTHCWGLVG